MLQEEFPDVERSLIVLAVGMIAYDVEEAHDCFQSAKPICALRADFNQNCNRTSLVYRFRDLPSASASPIAPAEDSAAIPSLFDETRSRPDRGFDLFSCVCVQLDMLQ
jgi:hypothetical protein